MRSGLCSYWNPRSSVAQTGVGFFGRKVLNVGVEIVWFLSNLCFFLLSLSLILSNKPAVAIIGIKELKSSLCCEQTREQSEDQASLFRAGLRAFESQWINKKEERISWCVKSFADAGLSTMKATHALGALVLLALACRLKGGAVDSSVWVWGWQWHRQSFKLKGEFTKL